MVENIAWMCIALNFYVIAIFERDSREVRSSGILHSIYAYLGTDVKGQPIGPISKDQPVQACLAIFFFYLS